MLFRSVLTSLNADAITRDESGKIVAKAGKKDQTILGAALGGAVGLIFGGNRRLENTAIGGALGALIGSQIKSSGAQRDVVLKPGTRMGVKLNRDVILYEPNGGR